MFYNAAEFQSHALHTFNRYAKFAVIYGCGPGWCVCHIEKCLASVQHYCDGVARHYSNFIYQIAIMALQRVQKLSTKSFRRLLTFITQRKMAAALLAVIRLIRDFTCCFREMAAHYRVIFDLERPFPCVPPRH